MSAEKVRVPKMCNDCGKPHGRPAHNVSLCFDCRSARLAARSRTPKYRAWQAAWNRSAAAKLAKARWRDRQDPRELAARWHTRHIFRMAFRNRQVKCSSLLCENTFIRPRGSHRRWCDTCAVSYYGESYLKWRSINRGSRKNWGRAA